MSTPGHIADVQADDAALCRSRTCATTAAPFPVTVVEVNAFSAGFSLPVLEKSWEGSHPTSSVRLAVAEVAVGTGWNGASALMFQRVPVVGSATAKTNRTL